MLRDSGPFTLMFLYVRTAMGGRFVVIIYENGSEVGSEQELP